MVSVIALLMGLMLGFASCQGGAGEAGPTSDITSGRTGNASISGTVTYRERLALTEGATLKVELRDTSLADAAAPLIASQTISGPGQVPITFRVEYNEDDIDPRNTYSISASIIESDGRLAFTNGHGLRRDHAQAIPIASICSWYWCSRPPILSTKSRMAQVTGARGWRRRPK